MNLIPRKHQCRICPFSVFSVFFPAWGCTFILKESIFASFQPPRLWGRGGILGFSKLLIPELQFYLLASATSCIWLGTRDKSGILSVELSSAQSIVPVVQQKFCGTGGGQLCITGKVCLDLLPQKALLELLIAATEL